MKNGDLDAIETSGIGWLLAAHASLAFKPAIAARLNHLLAALPKEVLEKQINLHGSKEDLVNLPKIFVNSRWQPFGAPPGRVTTQAVTLSCVNNRARLMKELISLIPQDDAPYVFIPIGLPTMESPELYKKIIVMNNDRQDEVQGLVVKGFSQELLSRFVDQSDSRSKTVRDYLLSHKSVISVQETH
jgi:hypothetical protein